MNDVLPASVTFEKPSAEVVLPTSGLEPKISAKSNCRSPNKAAQHCRYECIHIDTILTQKAGGHLNRVALRVLPLRKVPLVPCV